MKLAWHRNRSRSKPTARPTRTRIPSDRQQGSLGLRLRSSGTRTREYGPRRFPTDGDAGTSSSRELSTLRRRPTRCEYSTSGGRQRWRRRGTSTGRTRSSCLRCTRLRRTRHLRRVRRRYYRLRAGLTATRVDMLSMQVARAVAGGCALAPAGSGAPGDGGDDTYWRGGCIPPLSDGR